MILWCLFCSTCGPDLTILRENYMKVDREQLAARTILETSQRSELPLSLKKGYHGAATMCLARFGMNPANKIALFREGRAELEEAIRLDPASAELVFLRYTIQENAPAFLQYKGAMDSDLRKINNAMGQLAKTDPQLYVMIRTYLLTRR